jgi:RND family efflux transporter MFP subunit
VKSRARQTVRTGWSLLGVALLAGCGGEEVYEKPPIPVRIHAMEASSLNGGLRYSANIKPHTQVDLAFKVGGYVHEIHQMKGADGRPRLMQEGDHVTKGTILARLRASDYLVKRNQAQSQQAEAQATIQQAKSQQAEAQANFEQAKLDFDRAANLFASQSLTKSDYDAAKARLDMAQAKVDTARAQLQQAGAKRAGAAEQREETEIALQDSALKTPMDAVVLKRNIEVGTLVNPGMVGFVLADTSSVKAVFGVPDMVVERLKVGKALAVTTEAIPGVEFRGQITSLAPAADPSSRVFDVELTIPNQRDQLKSGMITAVSLGNEVAPVPYVSVPLTAVVRPAGSQTDYAVFIVDEQAGGKPVARLRKVSLGQVVGSSVAVTDGLNVGDQVIVTGATLVSDGQPVRVMP